MQKLKIGGSLGEWSDKVVDAVQQAGDAVQGMYDNTINDIQATLGNVGECLAAMDDIRLRVAHRTIEYQTMVTRALLNAHFLSREVIEEVWRFVKKDIRRDPRPAIYYVPRPFSSDTAVQIDPETYEFPPGRKPSLFVHGKGYSSSKNSAYSFFSDIEEHVQIFSNGHNELNDVYLVSYDTELTDEDEIIIRAAFQLLLGIGTAGEADPLILAVFWRELERRAAITGDYILPFLRRIAEAQTPDLSLAGFAITHSLGCFTFASAAQKLIRENENNRCFLNWLCMAAAIPSNGFTSTGGFTFAPLIAGGGDGPRYGTSVWYSRLDLVLNLAYTLATGHLALGATGSLDSVPRVYISDMDVTQITKEDHYIAYFKKLGNMLRDEVFNR
ncbi:hypothetical protein C0Q44_28435 [Paenibacillus sp. PCH8]|uniref:hypothetical protein n=1 Tax=Paenibacillus sp. PCH8 TaxID=2066524 RepID=UPI000CF83FCF|nr:hypothetical protein [Paenibacillus sp. PCH8]PQP80344.1 hypothetical protein C0Q44_28435 [Paenibacillus sp. PCH8]